MERLLLFAAHAIRVGPAWLQADEARVHDCRPAAGVLLVPDQLCNSVEAAAAVLGGPIDAGPAADATVCAARPRSYSRMALASRGGAFRREVRFRPARSRTSSRNSATRAGIASPRCVSSKCRRASGAGSSPVHISDTMYRLAPRGQQPRPGHGGHGLEMLASITFEKTSYAQPMGGLSHAA